MPPRSFDTRQPSNTRYRQRPMSWSSPSAVDNSRPYPCVFHEWRGGVGDPTPTCRTFQSYVSRLAIHHRHRRHAFIYCTKCFRSDFINDQQFADHIRAETCLFRCVTDDCRNYDVEPPYANHCSHGLLNSQRCIWRKLYRMARGWGSYDDRVPDPLLPTEPPSVQSPTVTEGSTTYFPNEPSDPNANAQSRLQDLYQHLRLVGTSIWPLVNCEEPQWPEDGVLRSQLIGSMDSESLPSEIFNPNMCHHVQELRALLVAYGQILSEPHTRTSRMWDQIAHHTRSLLGVQTSSRIPWRTSRLLDPRPSGSSHTHISNQNQWQPAWSFGNQQSPASAVAHYGIGSSLYPWQNQQPQPSNLMADTSAPWTGDQRLRTAQNSNPFFQQLNNTFTQSDPTNSIYQPSETSSTQSQYYSAPATSIPPIPQNTMQQREISRRHHSSGYFSASTPGTSQNRSQRSQGSDPTYGTGEGSMDDTLDRSGGWFGRGDVNNN